MKKILPFLLLSILCATIVVGCKSNKLTPVEAVKSAFQKNDALNKFEVEVAFEGSDYTDGDEYYEKIAYNVNMEDKKAYFRSDYNEYQNRYSKEYYLMLDCISDNNGYVQSMPWKEFTGENYLDNAEFSAYNFDIVGIDFKAMSMENRRTKYLISVPDRLTADFIKESVLDESYSDIKYTNYKMILIIDSDGFWSYLEITFDFSEETSWNTESGSIKVSYSILSVGSDADFEIPFEVKDYIYYYYDKMTYSGPRSYQYKRNLNFSENYNPEYIDNDAIKYKNAFMFSYFDVESNTIIAQSQWWNQACIYDADTMQELYTLNNWGNTYLYTFGSNKAVKVTSEISTKKHIIDSYDLKTGNFLSSVEIINDEFNIFAHYGLYGNILICGNNYTDASALFINVVTGECYQSDFLGVSRSSLINYEKGILYADTSDAYKGIRILNFINISTGKIFKTITMPDDTYYSNPRDLMLIGNGLSFAGKLYDPENGDLISENLLIKDYTPLLGFVAETTIYSDNKFDIVAGYNEYGKEIAVYDNKLNKYVFRTLGDFIQAEHIGNGKYFLRKWDSIAFLDTTKISGSLEGNLEKELTILADKNVSRLCFSEKYTDAVINGNLIFVASGKTIKIYNADTLAKVIEMNFSNNVFCLDSYEGYLAAGFGKGTQDFSLIKISDWSISTIATEKGVTDISIYENCIYFTGRDYWDNIFCYDISEKTTMEFTSTFSNPYFSINKSDGILYVGETGSSSCDLVYIDLKTGSNFYTSPFSFYSYNSYPVFFDGTNVHYYGNMFDPMTGMRRLKNEYELMFPQMEDYTFLGAIYYDGRFSVTIAEKDGQKYTVFYDTIKGDVIKTEGDAERVIKYKNEFFIIRPERDTWYCITIS